MTHHLLSAAPVLLGGAVRPPLNLLTAFIGLGGLALGAWLAWIGVFFDRRTSTSTPSPRSVPPTPPTEASPAPEETGAVV